MSLRKAAGMAYEPKIYLWRALILDNHSELDMLNILDFETHLCVYILVMTL